MNDDPASPTVNGIVAENHSHWTKVPGKLKGLRCDIVNSANRLSRLQSR